MPIVKENVYGGPNIGVFLRMNNQYLLYPPKINPKLLELIQEMDPTLNCIETFIAKSSVLGSYVAMNSFGMVVPHLISDDELDTLRGLMQKNFQIVEIETESNAFGNLILCNDQGAILSSKLKDIQAIIAGALKVPVKIFDFAQSNLPGACGIANNHGVLVHPLTTEQDADVIASTLHVDIDVSTINCGSPYLGGGAIVNDRCGIFGRESTGPEIQRLMEVLNLR